MHITSLQAATWCDVIVGLYSSEITLLKITQIIINICFMLIK